MGEQKVLLDEYWDLFDELSEAERLNYTWSNWGDLILDVVRDWEPETLKEGIKELKEMLEVKND